MQKYRAFFEQERRFVAVLMGWAVGSMVTGALLSRDQRPFVRQMGIQFFAWGLIDALLAVFGLRGNHQTLRRLEDGTLPTAEASQKADWLESLLWINTGLDVLYVLGGRLLYQSEKPERQGIGYGIIIQGGFLLIFDFVNATILGNIRRDG